MEIMILAGHRYNGRLGAYPGTINENSRHQTYATEKLLNVKKKTKSYIFGSSQVDRLLGDRDMTRDGAQSCVFNIAGTVR